MIFKEIIALRPYTFIITTVAVFAICVAFILSIPSQVQVKSAVQVAMDRNVTKDGLVSIAPFTDIDTTAKRLSLIELDLILSRLNISDPALWATRVDAAGQAIVVTSNVSQKFADAAKEVQQLLIDKILENEGIPVSRARREREEGLVLTQQAIQSLNEYRNSVIGDLTELAASRKRIGGVPADQHSQNSEELKAPSRSIVNETEPNLKGGSLRERIAGGEIDILLALTERQNLGLILAKIKENLLDNQKRLTDVKNSLAAIEPAKILEAPTTFPQRGQPSRRGLLLITALIASLLVAFLAVLTRERFAR